MEDFTKTFLKFPLLEELKSFCELQIEKQRQGKLKKSIRKDGEKANFSKDVIRAKNVDLRYIDVLPLYLTLSLTEFLKKEFNEVSVRQTGRFLYPKGGYMDWHTNSDMQGYRYYICYCLGGGESSFSYINKDKKEIKSLDLKGFTARRFFTSRKDSLWHRVDSNTNRVSIGFYAPTQ